MEGWQRDHILKNLVELIKLTSINTQLIASLKAKKVLNDDDVEEIEHQMLKPSEKSKKLYEILPTKTRAFDILIQSLTETRQTGAAKILREHTTKFREYGSISVDENHIIGIGASSKVLKGKFESRDVAVKVFHTNFVEIEMIHQEVDFLRKLDSHENIVRHFIAESHEKCIYVALELCVISLQDEVTIKLLKIDPTLTLLECTKGLNHLHKQNVIHRDLKPANILLTESKQVKIADFGLSKRIPIGMSRVTINSSGFGTADWMAPEILEYLKHSMINNQPLKMSKSTDIFSLGCIFYFTLTNGLHPFGNNLERLYNISNHKPQLIDTTVSDKWIVLIRQMISKTSKDRPTANEILKSNCFETTPHFRLMQPKGTKMPENVLEIDTREHNNDFPVQLPAPTSKTIEHQFRNRLEITKAGIRNPTKVKNVSPVIAERQRMLQMENPPVKSQPIRSLDETDPKSTNPNFMSTDVKECIQTCIKMLGDQYYKDRGLTLLHMAVLLEQKLPVEYLISMGNSVNEKDNDGFTPLHWSCYTKSGVTQIFPSLIAQSANINAVNNEGDSILHLAAVWNRSKHELERIVRAGADKNMKNNSGHSILHSAVTAENLDAIKYFIALGIDIESRDKEGETPIFGVVFARKNGSETMKMALRNGANINAVSNRGYSILHQAAYYGRSEETLKAMIEAGADKNLVDTEGNTVMHAAVSGGNMEAIKYFISIGVNIDSRDNYRGTPLHGIVGTGANFKEKFNMAISNGADINAVDNDKSNILHLAVSHGMSKEDLEMIVESGAEINSKNRFDETVLHVAVESGNVAAVEYFIEIGLSIHERSDDGWTPFHVLAYTKTNFDPILRILLRHGVHINTPTKYGETLLSLLREHEGSNEHIDVVIKLGGK